MLKKALSVLLVSIMLVSSMQAATAAVAENAQETYTIDYLFPWGTPVVEYSDQTRIGKIIKDKFNIVFRYIPYSGNWSEKVNLMLAGGDYPELLEIQGNTDLLKYVQAGALLSVDDYIGAMPQFAERYNSVLSILRSVSPDGKLYNWQYNQSDFNTNLSVFDMTARLDALEQQGWPSLESEDDWIAFLKKAMEENPTTNGQPTLGVVAPFGESWGMAGIAGIMYEKGGRYTGVAGNGSVIFNHDAEKYEDYFLNEYVKESFHFFNKLYREGILDPECFTDLGTQVEEKFNSGRALATWYVKPGLSTNLKAVEEGRAGQQYMLLPIRSNTQVERNEKRRIMELDIVEFSNVVMTKNAKQPERIMALLDWASSEEGQTLLQAGVEGEDYTIGENGALNPTEANIADRQDAASTTGWGLFNFLGNDLRVSKVTGKPYNPTMDWAYRDQVGLTEDVRNAYAKLGWADSVDYWRKTSIGGPSGIASSIVLDPTSELGMLSAKMTEFRVKNTAKLIMAQDDTEFEALYQSLVAEYNALNPQTVVDEYNRLYGERHTQIYGK